MNGQRFETCYVVQTTLQASSTWMMASFVANAWGVVRCLIEFIKDLAHLSGPSFASLFFVSPDCRVQC